MELVEEVETEKRKRKAWKMEFHKLEKSLDKILKDRNKNLLVEYAAPNSYHISGSKLDNRYYDDEEIYLEENEEYFSEDI